MISVQEGFIREPYKTPVDTPSSIALGLKELRIDSYDDDDDDDDIGLVFIHKLSGFTYLPRKLIDEDAGMDIYSTESVIVSVSVIPFQDDNNEEEHSYGNLKVWVYQKRKKMYVHHEISLPALPLCTEWLGCPLLGGGGMGNFLAVGSTQPSIEIWDLDPIEVVKPCLVLGGTDCHTDSVLGLAWNRKYRNVLASASADKRVKMWDIVAGRCDNTMEHHSDKVQAVAWNPNAPHALLSGSFDCTLALKDVRMPSRSGYQWSVTAAVKSLAWNPSNEHHFVVGLENGNVTFFDIRTATSNSPSELSTSTSTLRAHDKAVTSVSYNLLTPNLFATGSADETVKLWDLSTPQSFYVASHNPKAGAVLSIAFLEANPFLLAIGGSSGELKVWDIFSIPRISQEYGI